jgi:hypothetical protein
LFRDIPVFCHLKRVRLPSGDILLEINYIFFFAHNGSYNIACIDVGAHDGDWEHVTVRCTTDGRLVAGVQSSFECILLCIKWHIAPQFDQRMYRME